MSLDFPTSAPGWPTISLGPDGHADRIDTPAIPSLDDKSIYISEGSPQTTQGDDIFENCIIIFW